MIKKTSYKVIHKKTLFSKAPIFLVDCKIQTPSGKILRRQILEHPGCVVIIPRTDSGKYILVKQYRFPIKKWLWEFPAGGKEPDESILAAATRELMEEIGMKPGRLQKLLAYYPTPGVSAEKMHVFLATRLKPQWAPKDEDEDFKLGEFSLAEITTMIRNRKIVDGKTIIGFFYLKNSGLKTTA